MKIFLSVITITISCFLVQNTRPILTQNIFPYGNYQTLQLDSSEDSSSLVYICTGPQSECYHSNSSCRGLNNCSARIKSISIEEAKKMGRRKCKLCYKY